ncbi:ATP-binding protein [Cryobacterium tagatosivorans]|uniref:ATP-binding protein n=1 Tax=Cryobacterium tagatosivorans TaxID=1259199 RepID=UPI00141AE6CB|nr:ATP-binding protein [Cryobacterium tagatosivorans]
MDIFGIGSLDVEHQRELVRKHLMNLTTSYSDESDVFTEVLQNAIDAIALRDPIANPDGGNLTIVVGRRTDNAHYLYVQDDGVGMSEELVDRVFIPGYSFGKKHGKSIGYKGVGMSYIVAVSDHIAIRSVKEGLPTDRTILHTNDWVTDSEKPQPTVDDSFSAPQLVKGLADGITRGTGVYFEFHSGSDPKSLDNLVIVTDGIEKELRYWAGFLCAKTPLGLATSTLVQQSNPMKVQFIVDRGDDVVFEEPFIRDVYAPDQGKLGYPFPETVFVVGVDTNTIDSTPVSQHNLKHARRHQAVFHEWSGPEFIEEMVLDDDEKTLLLKHLHWVRGYLCYSTDVMKQVKKNMGTRGPAVRYGARLAVDGAPQGRPLDLSLTSDQGLDRQTHIVLGFSELELDTGRKFVSNEKILHAINKVNQRVVTKLKDYRWALKIKDRVPIETDLAEWIKSVDERAGNSSLPALFAALGATPPARVDPNDEQEVIALWTALVTTAELPGFAMKALSGYNRYDALATIGDDAMTPTGSLAAVSPDYAPKENAVLEFKVSFDSLISDFEAKVKIPSEVDVVVCWDCTDLNLRVGRLEPTYGKWKHARPFRAVSYIWHDDASSTHFNVISLKNVIAELLVAHALPGGLSALGVLENRDDAKLV